MKALTLTQPSLVDWSNMVRRPSVGDVEEKEDKGDAGKVHASKQCWFEFEVLCSFVNCVKVLLSVNHVYLMVGSVNLPRLVSLQTYAVYGLILARRQPLQL